MRRRIATSANSFACKKQRASLQSSSASQVIAANAARVTGDFDEALRRMSVAYDAFVSSGEAYLATWAVYAAGTTYLRPDDLPNRQSHSNARPIFSTNSKRSRTAHPRSATLRCATTTKAASTSRSSCAERRSAAPRPAPGRCDDDGPRSRTCMHVSPWAVTVAPGCRRRVAPRRRRE